MHRKYILHKVQLIEIPYCFFEQPNKLEDISGGTTHIHINGVIRSTFPIGTVNECNEFVFKEVEYALVVITVLLEYITKLNEHRQRLNSRCLDSLLSLDRRFLL